MRVKSPISSFLPHLATRQIKKLKHRQLKSVRFQLSKKSRMKQLKGLVMIKAMKALVLRKRIKTGIKFSIAVGVINIHLGLSKGQ